MSKLLILLLLFPTTAYSKVMDTVWDGKCIPITDKYQHRPMDVQDTLTWTVDLTEIHTFDYAAGFIPPGFQGDDTDLTTCVPERTGGPK